MNIEEKRLKARADARPKKVMTINGTDIFVEERNYIIKKGNKVRYFSDLTSALVDISDELEKSLIKENLLETIKWLKEGRKEYLKAISSAVHSLERK
ncbi:MAG: hypothetical protein ACR2IQ_02745 [Minisyncoccia bacterium]